MARLRNFPGVVPFCDLMGLVQVVAMAFQPYLDTWTTRQSYKFNS